MTESSRRKQIINIRAKLNEIETKKFQKASKKLRAGSCQREMKLINLQPGLSRKKKKRRAQINKIRNKKEKSMEIAQKLKTKLPYDPKIPHLGIIQIK